ncbi:hypothetical protein [Bergeriella denitrificans]|uniref:hypothetical protein n=1 Tax=Bergeriella denitrificans TaxID=494 RepID=UPI0008257CCC|nr:hypothetical protein [Bergeriella denitrificans]
MAEATANLFLEPKDTKLIEQQIKSASAKKAANIRHAKNQALKEQAIRRWYQEIKKPKPKSKNALAADLAKEFSLSVTTVRRWLQGVKELSSTDEIELPF